MREICLHDTRSQAILPLRLRDPGRVSIYVCGPTVYGRLHVGNARPFVVFSLLKRFLEHEGLAVTLVINITDINDKIYAAATAAGIESARLAMDMTRHYVADTDALGLGRPDYEPKASEVIDPIVEHIETLIEGGHAYEAEGDVFFRVRTDPHYGELSHRVLDEMDQGEEREGSERKQDPVDFALWKRNKPSEDTAWDSPWGRGRPGWHIECSVMAEQLLGLDFDVHGGGIDLLFPHHENEAAQTRTARHAELARLWMHNGMLQMGGEKMAKSVGNIAPLHEVLDEHGRDVLIMYFLGSHYRQPIAFAPDALEQARANVERIREAGRRLEDGPSPADLAPVRERFFDALADDFNTPEALAALFAWVREANRRVREADRRDPPPGNGDLREMLGVLGLENLLEAAGPEASAELRALADQRSQARANGDFAAADRLRDEIAALGWQVRDVAGGYELLPR